MAEFPRGDKHNPISWKTIQDSGEDKLKQQSLRCESIWFRLYSLYNQTKQVKIGEISQVEELI